MALQSDEHRILKTLDNPKRFLFWTIDIVLIFFLIFILGILFHISLLLLIFPIKIFYSKMKRKFPGALIKHKVYWSFPHKIYVSGVKNSKIPPSHIEEILL